MVIAGRPEPHRREVANLLVIQGLPELEGGGAPLWRLACHLQNDPVQRETNLVTDQVVRTLTNHQREITKACDVPRSLLDLMRRVGVTHRFFYRRKHLKPLDAGIVPIPMPDHPNASNQRYVLTAPGVDVRAAWMAKE